MRFQKYFLILVATAACLYFCLQYCGFLYAKLHREYVTRRSYNEKKMVGSCKLSSADMEKEKLLSLSFSERNSMTSWERRNWWKNSQIPTGEWNSLFNLDDLDRAEKISCKHEDTCGIFKDSVVNELFFVDVSDSGPVLKKTRIWFDNPKLISTEYECYYRYIERPKHSTDNNVRFLSKICFPKDKDEVSLDENYCAVGIECITPKLKSSGHMKMKRSMPRNHDDYFSYFLFDDADDSDDACENGKTFYRDIFMYIPKVNTSKDTNETKPDYSVIMFTIDSTSRATFQRNLPLTTKYLKQSGGVLFQSHHRLGENSYPNVIPTLTGRKMSTLEDTNSQMDKGIMEDIVSRYQMKWAWEPWQDSGYPTMYHEDMQGCGNFNLHGRQGWRGQPTTIYHRAAYLAMRKWSLRNQDLHGSCPSHTCINNSPLHQRQLDVMKQLAKTYCSTPYFAWFHISEYSHDRMNLISNMDVDFLHLLQELDALGCLERTLLVVMGDHGHRGGRLSKSRAGWLDANTPLLFVRLPRYLKQKYQKTQENLVNNQNKLTTMLDIHKTVTDPIITNRDALQTSGHSVLDPLPERICETALVPEVFCTCPHGVKELDPEDTALMVPSEAIVNTINRKGNHSDCAKLKVDHIDWAFQDNKAYHIQLFLKTLKEDIDAIFHGVFNWKHGKVTSVERTELYYLTSRCIVDDSLDSIRPFCICNKI